MSLILWTSLSLTWHLHYYPMTIYQKKIWTRCLRIYDQVNNKEPKPTIDDILEKIQEMGIDSLTNLEKQILDEYAKT